MKYSNKYSNSVLIWLKVGLFMVFIQVVVGGITRLTESGLSITKWEVVSGTLPPLSDEAWQNEFDFYKETPQYKEINEGMSFEDFKFIYFWEYIHRFWARVMGFVFLFPFLWFLYKGQLDRPILKNLSLVILLAILAATFGWIMVASGLIERPWVNAYKLSLHLMIAFSVFAALLYTYLRAIFVDSEHMPTIFNNDIKIVNLVFIIFVFQLFLGGVLSGMKAAVIFPTWPDMHGTYFPEIIFKLEEWNADNFNRYDSNTFMPSLIHFLHRNTAYLLLVIGVWLSYRLYFKYQSHILKMISVVLVLILFSQALLGIITVLNSIGNIPVLWGVLHQVGALVLLSILVFLFFVLRIKKF
jgi:heme a synthase